MITDEKKRRRRAAFKARRLKLMNRQTYLHENYCVPCPKNHLYNEEGVTSRCAGCPIYGSLNQIGDGLCAISNEAFEIPKELTWGVYLLLRDREWKKKAIAKYYKIPIVKFNEFVKRNLGTYIETEEEEDMGRPQRGDRELAKELLKDTKLSLEAINETTDVPMSTLKTLAKKYRKKKDQAPKKEERALGLMVEEQPVTEELSEELAQEQQYNENEPQFEEEITMTEEIPTVLPELQKENTAALFTDNPPQLFLDGAQKFTTASWVTHDTDSVPAAEPQEQDIPLVYPEPLRAAEEVTVAPTKKVTLDFHFAVVGEDFTKEETLAHLYKAITLLEMVDSDEIGFELVLNT